MGFRPFRRIEVATTSIGQATLLSLSFATFFFDYDLDGRLDIFAANGHVADDIQAVQARVRYAQPPHLFRNAGNKRFEAMDEALGPAFRQPMVGRGAAYADYDRAKVLMELAVKNRDRQRGLVKIGGTAEKDLQQAETDYVTAEAEYVRAGSRLAQGPLE